MACDGGCGGCCCDQCSDFRLSCNECCKCVPRWLCVTSFSDDEECIVCSPEGARLMFDLAQYEIDGTIQYEGTVYCDSPTIGWEITVTLQYDEYLGRCVWNVYIPDEYGDALVDQDTPICNSYVESGCVTCVLRENAEDLLTVAVDLDAGDCQTTGYLEISGDTVWIELPHLDLPLHSNCKEFFCHILPIETEDPLNDFSVPCPCVPQELCITITLDDIYETTTEVFEGTISMTTDTPITGEIVVWEGSITGNQYGSGIEPNPVMNLYTTITLHRDQYTNACLLDVQIDDLTPDGEWEGTQWLKEDYEVSACFTLYASHIVFLPDVNENFVNGPSVVITSKVCEGCVPTIANPCCPDENGDPRQWPTTLTATLENVTGCDNLAGTTVTLERQDCAPQPGVFWYGDVTVFGDDPGDECRIALRLVCSGSEATDMVLYSSSSATEACSGWSIAFLSPTTADCFPIDFLYGDFGFVGCCEPLPPSAEFNWRITA